MTFTVTCNECGDTQTHPKEAGDNFTIGIVVETKPNIKRFIPEVNIVCMKCNHSVKLSLVDPLPDSFKHLKAFLEVADVPSMRKDISKMENIYWIVQNLGIRNSQKPGFRKAMDEASECYKMHVRERIKTQATE